MFSLLFIAALGIDFEAVKAEPVLEKRAQRALDFAQERLTQARKHYEAAEDSDFARSLNLATEGAEFCLTSLEAMGKHPSRNTRHYKAAELRLRELLRRLTTLRNDVSVDLRPQVVEAENRVSLVHEKLLDGVMSRKPRS